MGNSSTFNLKKVVQYGIISLLSITLLYFSFKDLKWEDFISGLKSCNYWWIALSMSISILAFYVRALRWRMIMLPLNKSITTREAFDGVTIAYLTNIALPRAGEFARCGVIAKTKKASFESILGTVVLERAVDLVSLIILIFTVIALRINLFGGFINREIIEPLLNKFSGSIIWVLFTLVFIIFVGAALIWYNRKKLLEHKLFQKIIVIVKGLIAGVVAGAKMEKKWLFLLYTAALWSCYWLMALFTIYAFPGVNMLNGVDALFLMIIGGLGWVVPVQGGLGAYHFIVSIALYSVYGIPQTVGVIFATISHESQLLTMIIAGAVSLLSISFYKNKSK